MERFVLSARRAAGLKGRVNVLVTSSTALRSLNQKFRGKDEPTDVLSFPAPLIERSKGSQLAGEIAISADIAMGNALRLGHVAAQEVKILALHGILHLAGFDHEHDNGEMAHKEASLRDRLRLPSGLIERGHLPARNTLQRRGGKARRTA
jgi:probable rRNA maturation factor